MGNLIRELRTRRVCAGRLSPIAILNNDDDELLLLSVVVYCASIVVGSVEENFDLLHFLCFLRTRSVVRIRVIFSMG